MIIGTVRAEEARVFDSYNGYHQFHAEESQEPYGSFEVFWSDGSEGVDNYPCQPMAAGWYWWAAFPGCIPDGDIDGSGASGPYANSRQALEDADEWNPEFDDNFAS